MKTKPEGIYANGDREGVSNFFDSPIIVTNRLLLRCIVKNGTYIPTEIVSLQKFMTNLKECNCKDVNTNTEQKTPLDAVTVAPKKRAERSSISNKDQSPRKDSDICLNPSSILLELSPDTENNNILNGYLVDRQNLKNKYEEQINWVKEDHDYVSMETVQSLEEFQILLDVIIKCGLPIGLTIRINKDQSYTVLYQLIESFKKDFMVLRVGERHCLFLEPF